MMRKYTDLFIVLPNTLIRFLSAWGLKQTLKDYCETTEGAEGRGKEESLQDGKVSRLKEGRIIRFVKPLRPCPVDPLFPLVPLSCIFPRRKSYAGQARVSSFALSAFFREFRCLFLFLSYCPRQTLSPTDARLPAQQVSCFRGIRYLNLWFTRPSRLRA